MNDDREALVEEIVSLALKTGKQMHELSTSLLEDDAMPIYREGLKNGDLVIIERIIYYTNEFIDKADEILPLLINLIDHQNKAQKEVARAIVMLIKEGLPKELLEEYKPHLQQKLVLLLFETTESVTSSDEWTEEDWELTIYYNDSLFEILRCLQYDDILPIFCPQIVQNIPFETYDQPFFFYIYKNLRNDFSVKEIATCTKEEIDKIRNKKRRKELKDKLLAINKKWIIPNEYEAFKQILM